MIEGRLVRLRAFEPADVPASHERINDPEVSYHLARRYPLPRSSVADFFAGDVDFKNPKFAIETLSERRLIGACDLRPETPEVRSANLGIVISDKTAWGNGYGTDAMRTLCRFGFDEMNLHRIDLWVHSGNDRAQNLYVKVGFSYEGTAREAWYQRGRYHDIVLMGLLRGELVG